MRVVYIGNYGRKLVLLLAILLLWVAMYLVADVLIKHNLLYNITIENCMEFSYPYGLVVDNILVSDKASEKSVQSSHSYSAPTTREFSSYKSLEGKFSFDYPSAFILKPQQFSGGDILYHIDFRNKADTAHGLVQVWKMQGSLDQFLKNSIAMSTQPYEYFKTNSIEVNGLKGYLWDYAVLSDGTPIKASEVFLEKDGLMYRISYFVPEKDWNDSQSALFWNMVKSFKTF